LEISPVSAKRAWTKRKGLPNSGDVQWEARAKGELDSSLSSKAIADDRIWSGDAFLSANSGRVGDRKASPTLSRLVGYRFEESDESESPLPALPLDVPQSVGNPLRSVQASLCDPLISKRLYPSQQGTKVLAWGRFFTTGISSCLPSISDTSTQDMVSACARILPTRAYISFRCRPSAEKALQHGHREVRPLAN